MTIERGELCSTASPFQPPHSVREIDRRSGTRPPIGKKLRADPIHLAILPSSLARKASCKTCACPLRATVDSETSCCGLHGSQRGKFCIRSAPILYRLASNQLRLPFLTLRLLIRSPRLHTAACIAASCRQGGVHPAPPSISATVSRDPQVAREIRHNKALDTERQSLGNSSRHPSFVSLGYSTSFLVCRPVNLVVIRRHGTASGL